MKLQYILILLGIYTIAYIFTYIIYQILNPIMLYIYTSIITTLLIIITIDSYNLINEINEIEEDNKLLRELLNIQIIENNKLEIYIKTNK